MPIKEMLCSALVLAQCLPVYASWSKIAGYAPGSKVTSHNALDLDQKAIELALGQSSIDYSLVSNIYSSGGNSKPYAEFVVNALPNAHSKGTSVQGQTSGVIGSLYSDYAAGTTTIKVAYAISDFQATYTSCKVGALQTMAGSTAADPYAYTSGCFADGETLTIGSDTIAVVSGPTNKAGRTLKGFSTGAFAKMYDTGSNGGCEGASDRATDGCPYDDYSMYYHYYGDGDYADKFVTAAIQGTATGFSYSRGNMDFTNTDDALRKECIKKGTAYMNAWMYAIREFEDAIDDCKAGCVNGIVGTGTDCNDLSIASVHAWDEGVAFYTGSLEGANAGGDSDGVFSYRLAEKRCKNFKTCGADADATSGTSYINIEMFNQFAIGGQKILMGQCEDAEAVVDRIVALGAIPLIQGTLRYAYKLEFEQGGAKERGEGAVFAAAIVPRVWNSAGHVNNAHADTIMNNMKVGATSTSFAAVKAAFEASYSTMGITCEEVGGLWFAAEDRYYTGAEPCGLDSAVVVGEEKEVMATWMIVVIIASGVITCGLITVFVILCMKEKKTGQPAFLPMGDQSGSTVGRSQNGAGQVSV